VVCVNDGKTGDRKMNDDVNIPINDETISLQEKVSWLTNKTSDSIAYMRRERGRNRGKASAFKLLTIFLSGAGAILLGVQIMGFDAIFRNIAFVLVTVVTLITALEPFYNYRSLWIEQERALAGLYKVRDNLNFYLAGTQTEDVSIDELNQIYKDIRSIWDQHSNAWLAYRKSESPTQIPMV
jgi:hypothetical protein